jgi:hypothetical protein
MGRYDGWTLGRKQEQFSRLLMLLLMHLHSAGYGVRCKHLLRCHDCKVGHKRSAHKSSLAIDIRLTRSADGTSYGTKRMMPAKEERDGLAAAHDYWDSIGGSKRIERDLGHFSIKHQGVR